MKKMIGLVLIMVVAGCSAAITPPYIQDKNPFKKRFYATFGEARVAIERTLKDSGWQIAEAVDPVVYEQSDTNDLTENQLLMVTEQKTTSLWTGSRYSRLNVFLRSQKNISEVELRYFTVRHTAVRNFRRYGDKKVLEKIMGRIESALDGKVVE